MYWLVYGGLLSDKYCTNNDLCHVTSTSVCLIFSKVVTHYNYDVNVNENTSEPIWSSFSTFVNDERSVGVIAFCLFSTHKLIECLPCYF